MKYKTKYSVIRYGCEIFTSDDQLIAYHYASLDRTKSTKVIKHNKNEWVQ